MRNLRLIALAIALWATTFDAEARPACPPKGYDRAALAALKAAEWRIDDVAARGAFARQIVVCLAAPDPEIRDGAAYEALRTMLRAGALDIETMNALNTDLMAMLAGPEGRGFARPFAALTLAEIARADRLAAFLTMDQRSALVVAAARYLSGVDDYRGFDETEGWRHGVAHGADLLLQLALNPNLGTQELAAIRDAVASQVAPAKHSYVFGESERLARPILFIARRGAFSEAEWTAWLKNVSRIEGAPFSSAAGLARRHNLASFLSALFITAALSEDPKYDVLAPGLSAAIRALP